MDIRRVVLQQLKSTVDDFTPVSFPSDADDAMSLSDFMLDSVAYTSLMIGLEGALGFIPMGILQGISFPETIGELIAAYESEAAVVA